MLKKEFESIFDVPIKSVDGSENFLEQFRGKILFFVNTTGQCGNSQQWPAIERILGDYKDRGVEVIYTPTNDYCGSVTFNDYEYGIEKGQVSADYAFKRYSIKAHFTELVSSRNKVWEAKNKLYVQEKQTWTHEVALPDIDMEQAPRDPLYRFLLPDPNKEILTGNFHKILTNRAGQPVALFHNGTLVNAAYDSFNQGLSTTFIDTAEKEEEHLRAVLEEVLSTDNCTDTRYKYDPYSNIYPYWVE